MIRATQKRVSIKNVRREGFLRTVAFFRSTWDFSLWLGGAFCGREPTYFGRYNVGTAGVLPERRL